MQWTVQGTLHLKETAGLGGRIDVIEVSSHGPQNSNETVSGPSVPYTPRQLGSTDRVRPDEIASYPLRYSYRTDNGASRRIISVYVQFTDSAGHHAVGIGSWTVR